VITYRKSDIPAELQQYFEPAEIGLEQTPDEYVAKLVEVFREVKRVLRDDGVLFLNLGDSYATAHASGSLKPKDLIGIPWMVAFALRADGWYLRSDIIWSKPNPMPESVKDRPTKAHEYIFLLTKNAKYYYDHEAIMEPYQESSIERKKYPLAKFGLDNSMGAFGKGIRGDPDRGTILISNPNGRNKRSVWTVATASFKGAHFAVFPEALITPCILAGCPANVCSACGEPQVKQYKTNNKYGITGRVGKPMVKNGVVNLSEAGTRIEKGHNSTVYSTSEFIGYKKCSCNAPTNVGVVLDPFCGSGTTGVVSGKYGRDFIGIELNPDYVKMANERVGKEYQQMRIEL